jgi:hypothetical protein
LPDELSDRQQDGVEPLLAIADLAGKGWEIIARAAVKELCAQAQQSDDSIGVQLLTDIRQLFESRNLDKIPSAELADALIAIETSPWAEWSHGKPITASKLARLLRPFDVTSRKIRTGDRTPWGYERTDFEDAFRRYLPPQSLINPSKAEQAEHANVYAANRDFFKAAHNAHVPVSKTAKSPMFIGVVPDVPVLTLPTGGSIDPPGRSHAGVTGKDSMAQGEHLSKQAPRTSV